MNKLNRLALTASMLSVLLAVSGCSDNDNFQVNTSNAISEAHLRDGVILYSGYSFQLHRVTIDGQNYIANTMGGLVKE